jgi:peptidoglycan/LPS O-acetylase OafA/YrhL
MRAFVRSTPGQIILLAIALATGGAAIAAAFGGMTGLTIFTITTFLTIPAGLYATGLAIHESETHAAALIVFSPLALFAWQLVAGVLYTYRPAALFVGAPIAAAALALAVLAPAGDPAAHSAPHSGHDAAAPPAPRGA